MEAEVVGYFESLEAAEAARDNLVQKGVPTTDITLSSVNETEAVGDEEAHGLNLGAGVLPDAIPTIIEEHSGEVATASDERYVIRVRTHGDALNDTIAREVLSSATGYLA